MFARLGRGARRIGVPLVIVVAALVALVLSRHRQEPPDFGVTDVVRVGVSQGASIPGYLADSRSRLAQLSGAILDRANLEGATYTREQVVSAQSWLQIRR